MTQYKLSGSYREFLAQQLRDDPEFAAAYLRDAFESLGKPEERAVSL
ncbi:transcriptional regulator, partial [Comamonadaceae bacterium OH2545_COT-014]